MQPLINPRVFSLLTDSPAILTVAFHIPRTTDMEILSGRFLILAQER